MSKTKKQLEKKLRDTDLKISEGEKERRSEDPITQKAAFNSLEMLGALRKEIVDGLKRAA